MTTILHVGSPKSGTTTLQENVLAHLDGIVYLGKPFPTPEMRQDIEYVKRYDASDFSLERLKSFVAEHRATAEAAGKPLVFSDETLTSPGMKSLVAERLHEVFGPARIIVTLRNQHKSIESYYTRHGRTLKKVPDKWAGSFVPFDDWFDTSVRNFQGTQLDRVRYDNVVDVYGAVFGRENIVPLLFEEMIGDADAFGEKLGTILGVAGSEVSELLTRPALNTRPPALKRDFHRAETAVPYGLRRAAGRILPRGIKDGIKASLERVLWSGDRDSRMVVSDEKREEIRQMYADGNRRLVSEFGLELERYGYPL